MSFKVDSAKPRAALRALAYDVENLAARTMSTGMRLAESIARSTTTFKDSQNASTVHSRETIRGLASGTRGLFVAAGASRFLEDGTSAHVIWAKRALAGSGASRGTGSEASGSRVLRFVVAGRVLFRPYVFHPGTKATHFMRDAAAEAMLWMVDALEGDVGAAIRRRFG